MVSIHSHTPLFYFLEILENNNPKSPSDTLPTVVIDFLINDILMIFTVLVTRWRNYIENVDTLTRKSQTAILLFPFCPPH